MTYWSIQCRLFLVRCIWPSVKYHDTILQCTGACTMPSYWTILLQSVKVLVLPLCCWLLLQLISNGSNMYTAGSSSFASLFLQKLEMLLSRSECCCWGFCFLLVFCSYTLIFCFSIHCCVMEGVLLIQSLIKLISAIMLSSWLCYRNVAKILPRDAMHPRY